MISISAGKSLVLIKRPFDLSNVLPFSINWFPVLLNRLADDVNCRDLKFHEDRQIGLLRQSVDNHFQSLQLFYLWDIRRRIASSRFFDMSDVTLNYLTLLTLDILFYYLTKRNKPTVKSILWNSLQLFKQNFIIIQHGLSMFLMT